LKKIYIPHSGIYMAKKLITGLFVGLKKLFKGRRLFFLILALITFVIVRFMIQGRGAIEVETTKAEKKNITESISASGEISAEKQANITFPSAGKLSFLGVFEGDLVTKGQILASLDKTLLWASYNQAAAELRSAEASLAYTYDTVKGHSTDESFSQRETRTIDEVAKDKAYDAFKAAEYNLRNSTIYAPINGIATNFQEGLAVGVNILPTSTILSVVDPTTTYFRAEVNEMDIPKLTVGQKTQLVLDAFPDQTIEGLIKAIDFTTTTTSTGGTAYIVRVTIPNNTNFRMGMNGDASFIIIQKDAVISIPTTALVEMDGKETVWVIDRGKALKREVRIGSSSVDDVEITSGLTEGEIIVDRPPAKLKEGTKVKIKK